MTQLPIFQDKVLRFLRYEALQQNCRVLFVHLPRMEYHQKKTLKIVRHQVFQLFTWK